MKFKPYTNSTFEVIGVTRHPRNQDKLNRQGLYFTYILPNLTGHCGETLQVWSLMFIGNIHSYVYVEKVL